MAITVYTYNDKVLKNVATDKWLKKPDVDPYNPLGLPPNTVRVRTSDGNAPIKVTGTSYETATLVSGTTDIYDIYKSGNSFDYLLSYSTNVIEVLGANTTGITSMSHIFYNCSVLTTVPLFDTSNVTDMQYMFMDCQVLTSVPLFDTSSVTNMQRMLQRCYVLTSVPLFDTSSVTNMGGMLASCRLLTSVPLFDTSSVTKMDAMLATCISLTSVPLFDTSSVTDIGSLLDGCTSLTAVPLFDTSSVTRSSYMFRDCTNVQSGALALYQQLSTQATPPALHADTFKNCGSNTVTGAAELAQIPSDWGGTAT